MSPDQQAYGYSTVPDPPVLNEKLSLSFYGWQMTDNDRYVILTSVRSCATDTGSPVSGPLTVTTSTTATQQVPRLAPSPQPPNCCV